MLKTLRHTGQASQRGMIRPSVATVQTLTTLPGKDGLIIANRVVSSRCFRHTSPTAPMRTHLRASFSLTLTGPDVGSSSHSKCMGEGCTAWLPTSASPSLLSSSIPPTPSAQQWVRGRPASYGASVNPEAQATAEHSPGGRSPMKAQALEGDQQFEGVKEETSLLSLGSTA